MISIQPPKFVGLMVLLVACTVSLFTGCSGQIPTKSEIDSSVTYPEEYLISYQVETETGVITTLTKGIDASGNIYYKDADDETLYALHDGKYTKYSRASDGAILADESQLFTVDYVKTATSAFAEYAGKSTMSFSGSAKSNGTGSVAGRNTNSYLISVSFANFTQEYRFEQDDVTGICLQWVSSKAVGSHDVSETTGDFICTEYIDGDVSLPISESDAH